MKIRILTEGLRHDGRYLDKGEVWPEEFASAEDVPWWIGAFEPVSEAPRPSPKKAKGAKPGPEGSEGDGTAE